MKNQKWFKCKIGFGKDDYISIEEQELPTAIKAQVTGKVAIFKEGTIAGNNIISILPDWNKDMGWNRDYQLESEDYEQIGKEKQLAYKEIISLANEKVKYNIEGREGQKKLT